MKDELREAQFQSEYSAHIGRATSDEDLARRMYEAGKPKWIPVSERLPSEIGKYWITTRYGGMSQDSWNGVSWMVHLPDHVIAWMPLPEPYTEGE